jgi:hypothetical protein
MAICGQVLMDLARVSALECVGCLPGPVVPCGTAVCCIVQVEVRVKAAEVMDELQRLLGGSAISLEYGWHEDKAIGVALVELLLCVLQVVALAAGAWRLLIIGM